VSPESDEWPDEPDDPDPESRWGDPESRWGDPETDLVSVPSVESEELDPGSGGAGIEADSEVAKFFWASVIYANVAVGGVAVGLLLVGFRGQVTAGGAAIVVGLLALYRTYDVYQTYRERVVEAEDGDGSRTENGDGTGIEGDTRAQDERGTD